MKSKTRFTTRIFGLMLAVCVLVAALPLLPTAAEGAETNNSANYHPVDLSGMYNLDVFAYSGDALLDKAGSDNEWAEMLIVDGMSQELTLAGVPYTLGSFENGQYNAMCTNGDRTVAAEPGKYTTLNVLYTSSSGDNLTVPLELTYSDGSSQTVYVGDYDEGGIKKARNWGWEVSNSETDDPSIAMTATFRNNYSSGTKYIRGNTIAVESDKILTGITMKDNGNGESAWIMAMTLCGEPVDYLPLNLSNYFNMDAFKLSEQSKDTTNWWAYKVGESDIAALTNPIFNGVPYTLGSFEDGQMNALCANGADVSVPVNQGNYYTLHVLYASQDDFPMTLRLSYSDNTSTTVPVGDLGDGDTVRPVNWGSRNIVTDPIVKKLYAYGHNDDPNQNYDGERYIRSGVIAVDSTKVLTEVAMVDENAGTSGWIMAMTLGREKYNYVPQDLTDDYNMDAFKLSAESKDTTNWWAFVIDEGSLNNPTFDGVPFSFGSLADGNNNALCANGADKAVAVDVGHYDGLYVTYAASDGNMEMPLQLNYSDGTSETVSLGDFNDGGVIKARSWGWDETATHPIIQKLEAYGHNDDPNQNYDGSRYIRSGLIPVDSTKLLTGVTMVNNGGGTLAWIMAMTLRGEKLTAQVEDGYYKVDLSGVYNLDTFKKVAESNDSSDDNKWWSYVVDETARAELTNPTFGGVPYTFGSFEDGQNNAVYSKNGQVPIAVNAGNYANLYVLYASEGDREIKLTLTYSDSSSETVSVGDFNDNGTIKSRDWNSKNIGTDPIVKGLPVHGKADEYSYDGTKYIRMGIIPVDSAKELTNITMEQLHTENAWIMAMTLGAEKYDYVPQDLTNAYNMDAFKLSETSKDTTNWWAFLVEEGQLNKPTFAGVPYTLGSFADGNNNALSANGADAPIAVDEGTYDGLHLLYASMSYQIISLKLTYSDASSETVSVGDFNDNGTVKSCDWGSDRPIADPIVQKIESYGHNDDPNQNYDGEKYIRSGLVPVDSTKLLTGVTVLNTGSGNNAWIMAMTLRGEKQQFNVTSNTTNGTVTVNDQALVAAQPGDRVQVKVQADEGYVLKNGLLFYQYTYNGNTVTAPLYKRINSAVYETGEYSPEPDNVFVLTVPAIHSDVQIIAEFVPENAANAVIAADNALCVIGASYKTTGNPGLQFGSRVLTSVQVEGVTYELKSIGTLLVRAESLGQPADGQSWHDYLAAQSSVAYRNVPATKLMDLCNSYVDYSVRLVNMGGKEDAKYAAVAYATYQSEGGQELTLESALSKATSLNELTGYVASLS